MKVSWSNEETFKFIELYQVEPVIWDSKNALHKDKNKVNDAWNHIADTLQIPVSDLKKKKETLMSAFRLHFKKKQDSIRSGMGEEATYKPIWIFYDVMEAFLRDKYDCKSFISPEGQCNSSSLGELNEGQTETSNDDVCSIDKSKMNIKTPVKRRRAVKSSELERAEKKVPNDFNTSNQAMLNQENKIEGDCELYGRLLATKLRKYSVGEREEIMYEIDGLLLRRRHYYKPQHTSSPHPIVMSKRLPSSPTIYSSSASSSSD